MEASALPGAKILIVDDYPGNIDILCQVMPENYQIRTALSGLEALNLLQRTKFMPDLILLDVMMPQMDGYEVCRHLKQDARYRDIPVIFISAVADAESKIKGLQHGGVDYITKPYNFKEVKARIDIHLKLQRLNQAVATSNRQLEALVEKRIQDVSDMQTELIGALSSLISQRKPAAGEAAERFSRTVETLGQAIRRHPAYCGQVDDWFVEQLVKASPLYDIGNISIPDRVLGTKVPQDATETDLLARHTLAGAQALSEVRDRFPGNTFLDIGMDMARSHHERWDGRGYPDRLKGHAIPLAAQVMALASTLESQYAKGKGITEAGGPDLDASASVRLKIQSESGGAFAEELVSAYLTVADDIDALFHPVTTKAHQT